MIHSGLCKETPIANQVGDIEGARPSLVTLADRHVDTARRIVTLADGRTARLTTREAALLRYLADRPGQDVSRDTLLLEVWEYRASFPTRAVDIAMRRLRKKVESDPSSPAHLISVHGVGYRFVPPEAGQPAPLTSVQVRQRPHSWVQPLPQEPEGFVGRASEVSTLTHRLNECAGLVVLLGTGGVGKTRLALRVGHALRDRFDSVIWVDCSRAVDTEGLCRSTASALGVPLPQSTDSDALLSHVAVHA